MAKSPKTTLSQAKRFPNSRLKAEISSPSKYGGGVRDGDKL
ncbi:MAG: hypothetical protein ACLUKN_02505 [Bacilli bacterium]